MTEPPTSRSGHGPRVPAIIIAFARFVKRPVLPAEREPFSARAAEDVAWLLLLNIAIAMVLAILLSALNQRVEAGSPDFTMLTERGPAFTLLLGAVLIPLGEEIAFRSWLDGRRRELVLFALAAAAIGALWVLTLSDPAGGWIVGVVAAWIAASAVLAWKSRSDRQQAGWFVRGFALLYFAQALAFALLHLTNYEKPSWTLLLFVLPQLVAGLILGFARVRYGMWANVAIHGLSNSLFLTLMLADL